MTSLLCPRCREPYTGPTNVSGWLTCRRCNHRWLPSPVPAAGDPLPVIPAAAPATPPRRVPSPPVAAPAMATAQAAALPLPPVPLPSVPAVAAPPAALPADLPVVSSQLMDSGEYLPEETSELRRRTKALTSRRDGAPADGDAAQRSASPPAWSAAPTVSAPPPPAAVAVPPAPSAPAAASAPATGGDPFDPDLFDRMERDAQQNRAKQRTVADAPPALPVQPARPVTCPVCGHGFVSTKAEADQQICPQCHTSFNLAKGHVVSGGPRAGSSDPLIGRALRGCLIDRKLGEGGMGSVYHARQLSLDRSVAIKVLPPELARNRNFISRFEREAKSLAKINHPNILHIYDFGEESSLSIYFMIIEFVEGKDLGEILNEQFTLSQVEVLDVLRQASLGLEMAAEKGVIHRDIKPDNLMLTKDGICKVSDFGLAKGNGAERDVTNVGVRVGTPAFMSPEQCDGVDVDFRSDIYNLGCTAFLALTGNLPYDADTPFAIMLKHKNDPVPSLAKFNPNLHPRVDALVQRMIAKRPEDRFSTLREMIDLIEELEVAIAGTSAVLRKSRGPFRAMSDLEAVEHAKLTSQSVRTPEPSRPSPPAQLQAGDQRPPASASRPVMPAIKAAVPVARPASAPAGEGGLPDWLKPVDQPQVKRPSSATSPPPNAIQPTPAPNSGTSSAGSGMRDLRAKLAEARNRNLQDEAETIAADGDRLAASGQHEAAAAAWQRAAMLSPNVRESQALQSMAVNARRRGGRARAFRVLFYVLFMLSVIGVGVWQGTPLVHNLLAEHELAPIENISAPTARLRELDRFVSEFGKPYQWYVMVFVQPYQVEAAAKARQEADALRRNLANPAPTRPVAPAPAPTANAAAQSAAAELALLENQVRDQTVSWAAVQQQAEHLIAAGGPSTERAEAILAEAKREQDAMRPDIDALNAAWAAGRQGQVIEMAAAFREHHPRIGDRLPHALPGRLEVADADTGQVPAGLRIATQALAQPGTPAVFTGVDQLAAGETRFIRYADATVTIEASAPGYRTERLPVVGSPDPQEQVVKIALHPALVWQHQLPGNPAWLRLQPAADGGILVRGPDGMSVLRLADGVEQGTFTRAQLPIPPASGVAARWTDLWEVSPERVIAGTTDGLAVSLVPSSGASAFTALDTLYRGQGPVMACVERELTYQPGRRAVYVVEALGQALQLTARTKDKDLWVQPNLHGFKDPALFFHEDRVLVMDDRQLLALDEADGHQLAALSLSGQRNGAPAFLAQGRVVAVPTAAGLDLLRLPQGAGDIQLIHDPAQADPVGLHIAADADTLLVARNDRGLRLLRWRDDHCERLWDAAMPADGGAVATMALTTEYALIADDAGTVFVMKRGDGALLRRFSIGSPLLSPPIVQSGMLLLGDRDGRISAFALPPIK